MPLLYSNISQFVDLDKVVTNKSGVIRTAWTLLAGHRAYYRGQEVGAFELVNDFNRGSVEFVLLSLTGDHLEAYSVLLSDKLAGLTVEKK